VGRTDLPGGDWDTLLASMEREVLTLDDDIDVLPGHGPATTIGHERRTNPFLQGLA
ncbi:MAG: hydrolase, partial [bacterium]|nr:hydrolase [bacterium]